jgi:hypothetical protein
MTESFPGDHRATELSAPVSQDAAAPRPRRFVIGGIVHVALGPGGPAVPGAG